MTPQLLDPAALPDDLCRCRCRVNHPQVMPICSWLPGDGVICRACRDAMSPNDGKAA